MADREDQIAVYREAVSSYIERLTSKERSRLLRRAAFELRR